MSQLGSLRLGLPGLLLCCRLLDVPLTGNPRQFLLQRLLTRSVLASMFLSTSSALSCPSWLI